MRQPIALVTRMDEASEETWRQALADAMPDETIVAFRNLDGRQRAEAEVAIVANPDPSHVAALPGLQWAQSLWAGVERLVGELGPKAPPIVRLVDPEMSRVMAEAVLAWTYYLQRDMPAYRSRQAKALWDPLEYRHPRDITVGLLGLGELGSTAAGRLRGAGFKVIGWSRSAKTIEGIETVSGEEGLEVLLSTSDILVCLVPLTAATRGLLNRDRLSRLKRGGSIINFARGPLIVAADLIALLDEGHISHAVLDVFDEEPLPSGSAFWSHPAVTVLPHISGPTDIVSAASIVAGNVRSWRRDGTLPKTVDMQRGY